MTEVVIAVFHLCIVIALAYYFPKKDIALERFFWTALGLKLLAGICLGLLYRYYFPGGDTFVYFDDGAKLATLAWNDPVSYFKAMVFSQGLDSAALAFLEPRALFFTKITSLVNVITGNNYWATSMYFSLTSFLAAWHLVGVIRRNIPSVALAAMIGFLFMPSVVFWTSGVLKESVAMAAFFFLVALFLKVWFQSRTLWWEWVLAALAFWVFWNLKYYYAGAFIPIAVASLFYKKLVSTRSALPASTEAVAWVSMLIIPFVLVTFLHPNFNLDRLLAVIVSNNAAYNHLSAPGEYVRFCSLDPTPWSMLVNSPWALFSGLFRPLMWETSSIVQLAQGVENTLLLFLFCTALFNAAEYTRSPHRLLLLALITFVVGTCVFITFSAPNFGTLSRYRVGYISFFTFIVLCRNPVLAYFERSFPRLSGIKGKS